MRADITVHRPARWTRPFGADRVHWLGAAGVIAAANGLAGSLITSFAKKDYVLALFSGAGTNPVVWFALAAVAMIAFADGAAPSPLRRGDAAVILLALALALVPAPLGGSLAVLLTGGWLLATAGADSRARRTAFVLLALTGTLLWGRLALMMFGNSVLRLDGLLAAAAAGTHADGNVVAFTDAAARGVDSMVIAQGCSSLHNVTLAVLFWATLTQLIAIPVTLRSLLVCALAVAGNVGVNIVRLAVLATHYRQFDYWHDGPGGSLFAWAGLTVVVVVVMGGCYVLAPRRV